jgi:hypothetical protein
MIINTINNATNEIIIISGTFLGSSVAVYGEAI